MLLTNRVHLRRTEVAAVDTERRRVADVAFDRPSASVA